MKADKTYGVLLLLDVQNGAVLEGPLDDVGLGAGALDHLALLELAPEGGELLELDEVPDGAEGGLDDGRLADGGGCGNAGVGHDCGCVCMGLRSRVEKLSGRKSVCVYAVWDFFFSHNAIIWVDRPRRG